MTKLAIVAMIAALAIAMLMPHEAKAKARGDAVGAAVAVPMTDAAKAKLDAADAPMPPAFFATATTTHELTKSEKRAAIKALKAEIKRLQKEIKRLSR